MLDLIALKRSFFRTVHQASHKLVTLRLLRYDAWGSSCFLSWRARAWR